MWEEKVTLRRKRCSWKLYKKFMKLKWQNIRIGYQDFVQVSLRYVLVFIVFVEKRALSNGLSLLVLKSFWMNILILWFKWVKWVVLIESGAAILGIFRWAENLQIIRDIARYLNQLYEKCQYFENWKLSKTTAFSVMPILHGVEWKKKQIVSQKM